MFRNLVAMDKEQTISELRRKGLEVLNHELGAVGTVQFLRAMGIVQDDYTEWRRKQPEPDSIAEAVRLIQKTIVPANADTTNLFDRITINPEVMGGKPCVRGIRVRVEDILDMLAGGATEEEILHDFPYLEAEDIRVSLACAAMYFDSLPKTGFSQ